MIPNGNVVHQGSRSSSSSGSPVPGSSQHSGCGPQLLGSVRPHSNSSSLDSTGSKGAPMYAISVLPYSGGVLPHASSMTVPDSTSAPLHSSGAIPRVPAHSSSAALNPSGVLPHCAGAVPHISSHSGNSLQDSGGAPPFPATSPPRSPIHMVNEAPTKQLSASKLPTIRSTH